MEPNPITRNRPRYESAMKAPTSGKKFVADDQ